MGEVYRADDTELRRAVAFKALPASFVADPDRLGRFVQEARSASSVSHPNLVAIYDVGAAAPAGSGEKVHFIAMELVDGQTLRELLAHDSRDLRKMLDYCIQGAEALSAAHTAGVVHRDLKPENLMIATGGYLKVLDFGLAKLRVEPALLQTASKETTIAAHTEPGLMLGTVGYMAPEQAQGRAVDHRSDIFAFGCVIYEVATGARAFSGNSAVDTLHRIMHAEPAPLSSRVSGAPAELQRIVAKCLAKDPEERYQSMKELAIDLRSLRRQLDSGVSTVTMPPASRRVRRWIPAAGAAVLAIAAIAVASIFWSGREPAAPAGPLNIERLTASGGVIDAVISPDGKYLAYVESDGGLQSLHLRQLGGGRIIELVPRERTGYWGIAFSRDGQSIMYSWKSAALPAGTLYRIPVLGGRPQEVLTNIDSPITFSPDGKRIAFYRVHPADRSSSIVTTALDGSDARIVITKKPPEFYAPGFFVAPSWSPDGAMIAAVVRDTRARDARLTVVDVETGVERAFPERLQEGTFTAWLPDGSGIAVAGRRPGVHTTGNGGQIYIQPYPSGALRRLTNDMMEYRTVSFSSDGRQMVSIGFDIVIRLSLVPMEGGEPRLLPSDRLDSSRGLAWTADGSRLVFSRVIAGKSSIASMRTDGGDIREIVNDESAAWPAVSPDGKTLVYFAARGQQIGVWRSDIEGGNIKLLAQLPDANGIVFARDGAGVFVSSSVLGPPAVLHVPIGGGEPRPIAVRLDRPALSPDGKLLAGTYREQPGGPVSLSVLTSDTGTLVRSFPIETTSLGGSTGWTTDGSAIMFTTVERYNVWKRPLAGGEPEKVTRFSDLAIIRFAVSPDGRTLALGRGSQNRDAFLFTGFR